MKVMCKQSMSYYNKRLNITFSVTKGNMYNCQIDTFSNTDRIQVYSLKYSYMFSPLNFQNYFYTEKEYRKLKLQKLNESSL